MICSQGWLRAGNSGSGKVCASTGGWLIPKCMSRSCFCNGMGSDRALRDCRYNNDTETGKGIVNTTHNIIFNAAHATRGQQ